MPERAVLAHPPDRGGERLGQDELGEHLDGVHVELLDRCAFVAAVEVAQEVTAVAPIEREQAVGASASSLAVRRTLSSPSSRRDASHAYDVTTFGRDQRVLQVERRDVALGGQDLSSQTVMSGLAAPRPASVRTRACLTTDGRWMWST